MKIGINGTGLVQKADAGRVATHAEEALAQGFSSYWLAEHPTGGFDALTVLGAVSRSAPGLELGTAIIPTWLRHPMVLAGQAQTTANLMDARLVLGIGLSHAPMMAPLGLDFDKPIRHLREYLSILMPLLREGSVGFQGQMLSAQAQVFRPPEREVQVLVAALGPQALGVTGRLADGTVLAWVGERTVRDHIAPRLNEAAAAADRPTPRIVASLPVCVTDRPAETREIIGKNLRMYAQLPSYQAMFDREQVEGPAEVAIVGSAAEVEDRIRAFAEAGATDFTPTEFVRSADEAQATRELLLGLKDSV